MHTTTPLSHFLQNLLPDDFAFPFPLVGVVALLILYVILSNFVVDFICPAEYQIIDPLPSSSSSLSSPLLEGLSLEELEEMACFDYGDGSCRGSARLVSSSSTCAICLDGFESGESCRIFPVCNHVFHKPCIDLWLVKRPTCPTCRSPFRSLSIV